MKPTDEQVAAIKMALNGESFKISAYAGSGKTSTLKMIGNALSDQNGLYLAFNKAIATEASAKFPKNVKCQTFHSLAFRQTPDFIKEKLNFNRLMPKKIVHIFDLRDYRIPTHRNPSVSENLTGYDQAMVLNRAISLYCRSVDKEFSLELLVRAMPDWAHKPDCYELAASLVSKADKLWKEYLSPGNRYKITHDFYLKNWANGNPEIPVDFILFDEAQDADPVMLDVLRNQYAQVIYVGDRHQQIYGFRGAVNAMQSLDLPETKLTKSFRFGGEVSFIANALLKNLLEEEVALVGNENIDSRISILDQADAYLARTNAGAFQMALELISEKRKPSVQIDMDVLLRQVEDSISLQANIPLNKTSVFYGFQNWAEVTEYCHESPHSDLTPLVALIETHGAEFLIKTIGILKEVKDSDCIVSTAHKSKGLEFKKVKLHGDFFWSDPDEQRGQPGKSSQVLPLMIPSEAMLFYVACTRAIDHLDISSMQSFFNALARKHKLKELDGLLEKIK